MVENQYTNEPNNVNYDEVIKKSLCFVTSVVLLFFLSHFHQSDNLKMLFLDNYHLSTQ